MRTGNGSGEGEEFWQLSEGPSRDDIWWGDRGVLDSPGMDGRRYAHLSRGGHQEGGFARIAFDEGHLWAVVFPGDGRDDETGKASAGSEIDPASAVIRAQGPKLGAVCDVPVPDLGDRAGSDKIDLAGPALEEVG